MAINYNIQEKNEQVEFLQPTLKQSQQLEAFWNLMQTSDESVQYGLYMLLNNKYSASKVNETLPVKSRTRFRDMKGILFPLDVDLKDLRDEYLKDKYVTSKS